MSLTPDELTQFHRQGYLLKPGIFTAADLKPLQDASPRSSIKPPANCRPPAS